MLERPRRLRRTAAIRDAIRETHISPASLVQPLFIDETLTTRRSIASMPGIERLSVAQAVLEAQELWASGIRSVLLFGIPAHKDAEASAMMRPDGVVQRAIRAIKEAVPQMWIWADLCACEYTDHGHCGLLDANQDVANDLTLRLLAEAALSYAAAGVDAIAPSDMMDGRVGYLRAALDTAQYSHISIISYAVKYASAFYGPFREAADSQPMFGDRRTYQMDPANRREALREARLDVAEGADILIVKPAMAYLDIVAQVAERVDIPVVVYNVSGEYAMIKAAALQGWIDEERIVDELFAGFARAGASLIVSYFAKSYNLRHAGRTQR